MAVTRTVCNPRLVQGGPMETFYLKCANNQSWSLNQLLYCSSGLLTEAASNAVNAKYVALQAITDTSTGGTTYCKVGKITASQVFEMNELDGTITDANIDKLYSIDVTTNVVTFDVADNTTPCLKLVQPGYAYNPTDYATDDIKAVARVQFLQSVLDT